MVFWCVLSFVCLCIPGTIADFLIYPLQLAPGVYLFDPILSKHSKFFCGLSSVVGLCVSIFSFILSTMILEKSATTLVLRVSIDLKSTTVSLINWMFIKKSKILSEFICLWLSILGSNEFNSFIRASSQDTLRVNCLYRPWKPVFFEQ